MRIVRCDGVEYETYSFGQWLMKRLADPWKNSWLSSDLLRKITRQSRSPLIAETHRSPGSWRSMEIVYGNEQPVDLLDKMALRDNAISMAARNRRRFVVSELTRLLQKFSSERVINVLGIGAGPGLQVQDAFQNSGISPERLHAVFIDRDSDAFVHGAAMAREKGIEQSVQFLQGDACDVLNVLPETEFHIAKLVGIIEYLSDEGVIGLATVIRKSMAPNGVILTHGIQDPHHAMPFLERVFGLRHQQRSGEQVRELLQTAGFECIHIRDIPMRVYPMISASAGRSAA